VLCLMEFARLSASSTSNKSNWQLILLSTHMCDLVYVDFLSLLQVRNLYELRSG
jgi:hypothetical protein